MRSKDVGDKEGQMSGVLQELYKIHKGKADLPLMAYWSCGKRGRLDKRRSNTMLAPGNVGSG